MLIWNDTAAVLFKQESGFVIIFCTFTLLLVWTFCTKLPPYLFVSQLVYHILLLRLLATGSYRSVNKLKAVVKVRNALQTSCYLLKTTPPSVSVFPRRQTRQQYVSFTTFAHPGAHSVSLWLELSSLSSPSEKTVKSFNQIITECTNSSVQFFRERGQFR